MSAALEWHTRQPVGFLIEIKYRNSVNRFVGVSMCNAMGLTIAIFKNELVEIFGPVLQFCSLDYIAEDSKEICHIRLSFFGAAGKTVVDLKYS